MPEGNGGFRVRITARSASENTQRLAAIFLDPNGDGLPPVPAFNTMEKSEASWLLDAMPIFRIRRSAVQDGYDSSDFPDKRSLCATGNGRHANTVELPAGVSVGDVVRELCCECDVVAVQSEGLAHVPADTAELQNAICFETADISGPCFSLTLVRIADMHECAVEAISGLMRFFQSESCGRCLFCREGALHLLQMHDDIISGRGEIGDLDLIAVIADQMKSHCLCPFGKAAAYPIILGIDRYRHDYEHHIKNGNCAGGGVPVG